MHITFNTDTKIADDNFDTDKTVIVFVTNCIELKPYGVSECLENKYKHLRLFKERTALYSTRRATLDTQSRPGDVKIYVQEGRPLIAALTSHYSVGPPIEENKINLKKLDTSVDKTYVERLRQDTLVNRLSAFKQGLEKLWCYLSHRISNGTNINRIIFPVGSGVGLHNDTWFDKYYPILKEFASNTFSPNTINLVLVGPQRKLDSSEIIPDEPVDLSPKKRKVATEVGEEEDKKKKKCLH